MRLSMGTPKIAVHVAQLLDPLLRSPNIEIIVTRLPERASRTGAKLVCGDLLQHLNRNCQTTPFRFAEQQVDMFRHHHIPVDPHGEEAAHIFQADHKQVIDMAIDKVGPGGNNN